MNIDQREIIMISDGEEVMELDDPGQAHDSIHVKSEIDFRTECREAVLKIFPDICPEYLEDLAIQHTYDHEALVTAILDQFENGKVVPRRASLKRKRESEDDGNQLCDLRKKYEAPEWRAQKKDPAYTAFAKAMLRSSFPSLLVKDIYQVLADNNDTLFPSYLKLAQKEADEVFRPKKRPSKPNPAWVGDRLDVGIKVAHTEIYKTALKELKAVRALSRGLLDDKRQQQQREQEEADNFKKAVAEGTTCECECCCDEFALNRMVHCNGDVLHWFCRNCARLNAETQIGLSKFELNCMSMDGCTAGFSPTQKDIFLDEKTGIALERIEQETVLRLAGIENLETCPFCPYAAEYPPAEFDKEFRCERPDCRIVSCRLCRKETHIPKSCAEAALEKGHSGRRAIEEAMSAALIRKCNKCGTPFIKESGCNKMMCTRGGCFNVQCYVCNKSCDYSHFNDPKRGGKTGNCPLFDTSVEDRHREEVRRAEEEARRQAQERHPNVSAQVFEIKVSDKVKDDEERRRNSGLAVLRAVNRLGAGHVVIPGIPPGVVPQPQQGPAVNGRLPLAPVGAPGVVPPPLLGNFVPGFDFDFDAFLNEPPGAALPAPLEDLPVAPLFNLPAEEQLHRLHAQMQERFNLGQPVVAPMRLELFHHPPAPQQAAPKPTAPRPQPVPSFQQAPAQAARPAAHQRPHQSRQGMPGHPVVDVARLNVAALPKVAAKLRHALDQQRLGGVASNRQRQQVNMQKIEVLRRHLKLQEQAEIRGEAAKQQQVQQQQQQPQQQKQGAPQRNATKVEPDVILHPRGGVPRHMTEAKPAPTVHLPVRPQYLSDPAGAEPGQGWRQGAASQPPASHQVWGGPGLGSQHQNRHHRHQPQRVAAAYHQPPPVQQAHGNKAAVQYRTRKAAGQGGLGGPAGL